ncbi:MULTISPECIES: subtilase-type protease inhibitor [Thermomonospora]|uniref:Proteinase inhibitor I16 subtilisin-type inhibitor n=1 Tax=Thermomonospora curvata (strain ATCC 19995 / DSM 43183 / JCM 3096 / KCTC 9072 / NBRC 15933 / NCIMB 10081 / Henssen B9) TaxID=471852 RepID=D1A6I1_THECD|nr:MULTISPECIES: subtilase-type protease inhibitor [Thermomonospora]ACY96456.1 proteinase inhibitor I16 subtilisin-type inhibitor [Thermomonospora curvata DSM 43183]PKK15853.1 MAG: serine protease [Thermomonospora sp. CIF 1]
MSHLIATVVTGAALAVLPPAGSAPEADPAQHGRPAAAGTALRLTVSHPEAAAATPRSVTLSCDPPGGSHPRAAQACADLDRSGGRIVREREEAICTTEYRPVTARATGMWRGRPVTFVRTFPNPCVMAARTGAIFRF